MVVLAIPGGGEEELRRALEALGPVEVRDQSWFANEARRRGILLDRALERPRDLRFVAQRVDVRLLIRSRREDRRLEVTLISGESAEVVETLEVETGRGGLSSQGAAAIAAAVGARLGLARSEPATQVPAERVDATLEAATPEEEAQVEAPPPAEVVAADGGAPWLRVAAGGQLLKRNLAVVSNNALSLNYRSAFYPGYGLAVEAFVLEGASQWLGFAASFVQGFDEVSVPGTEEVRAVGHLQVEGGLLMLLRQASPSITASIEVRHTRFGVEDHPSLPTTSLTAPLLGGVLRAPLGQRLWVSAALEVSPFVLQGAGSDLFGQSALALAFGGGLGLEFTVSETLAARAVWRATLYHTSYEGRGSALFENASGFELVQGLDVGLVYRR